MDAGVEVEHSSGIEVEVDVVAHAFAAASVEVNDAVVAWAIHSEDCKWQDLACMRSH